MIVGLLSLAFAEDVARVLLIEPGVQVIREGTEVPLTPLLILERNDVLRTDETGAVILQLFNDHLVRLDSEIELPVSSLAMLRGVRSTVPVAVQLDQLLYPDESAGFGGLVDATEGIGGWHSRLTVAHSPVRGEDSLAKSPKSAPLPAGPPMLKLAKDEPATKEWKRAYAQGQEASTLESLLAPFQPGLPSFSQCIQPWATGLALQQLTEELQIHVALVDGRITKVWTAGHIPLPHCLRDPLLAQPAASTVASLRIIAPQ